MYLLNLKILAMKSPMTNRFTFHYVSIKSVMDKMVLDIYSKFTFHYVSIKSDGG